MLPALLLLAFFVAGPAHAVSIDSFLGTAETCQETKLCVKTTFIFSGRDVGMSGSFQITPLTPSADLWQPESGTIWFYPVGGGYSARYDRQEVLEYVNSVYGVDHDAGNGSWFIANGSEMNATYEGVGLPAYRAGSIVYTPSCGLYDDGTGTVVCGDGNAGTGSRPRTFGADELEWTQYPLTYRYQYVLRNPRLQQLDPDENLGGLVGAGEISVVYQPVPAPEPAGLAMFAVGLFVSALSMRRRAAPSHLR